MNSGASIWLNDIAAAWSSWMLGMAWIVAVLVVALSLVTMVLKGRSASLLYALWLLVLVRLLLPPDFAFPTGWGWWVRSDQASVSSPAPPPPPQVIPNHAADAAQHAPSTGTHEPTTSATLPFALILMIAWLGIVAARCGMLLTAALQVHVWVSRAQPILDPGLLDVLDECRDRVGVRRAVELRNSESCSTPLVVGVWRPVLLLPSAVLDRLSKAQLRSVLIHELHHVRRWDGLVNLLQGLLGAVYFFHPVVWWANRRIRQLREDACDERTVAVLEGNRKPYGEAIFRVAEILGYSAPPLTLGVLDSTSPLTQRLRRILDPRLPIDRGPSWKSTLILLAAVAILLPAGAQPTASVADGPHERRIVAEAFSDSPMGSVKKEGVPIPSPEIASPEELTPPEDPVQQDIVTVPDSIPAEETEPTEESIVNHRAIEELVQDLASTSQREAAVESLIGRGASAEAELLDALPTATSATRSAIYEILTSIGTEASLVPLQRALLTCNGFEERQVRQTLDAIYGRMKLPVFSREPSMNAARVYEQDDEDEWDEDFLAPSPF
jgi:beta-lactamase regulating signal transducer with metallopeptidase domain